MNSKEDTGLDNSSNQPISLEIARGIWQEFKWGLPGELNNFQTIQYCLEKISEEFPNFFEESSPELLMTEFRNKREEIFGLYRQIFPVEQNFEPFYHNINENDEWNDHVGLVMASSARMFLGMLRMQRNLKRSDENENSELIEKIAKKFGKNWLEINFTITDLKKLLAMAMGHETGEWWARGYWREILDLQGQEVDRWKQGSLEKDKIQKIEELAKKFRGNYFFKYFRNLGKTKKFATAVKKTLGGYGIEVVMSANNPTEFDIFFAGGEPSHVDFSVDETIKIADSKLAVLTAIFKSADFSQLLAPEYISLYGNQMRGSLALFMEMQAFRPSGVIGPEWKKIEDSSLSNFFFKNFFAKNFDDIMIQFFISSAEKISLLRFHDMQVEAIKFANDLYQGENSNIKKLIVLSRIFSSIFSQHVTSQFENKQI